MTEVIVLMGYELEVDKAHRNPGGGQRMKLLRTAQVSIKEGDEKTALVANDLWLKFFNVRRSGNKMYCNVASRRAEDDPWISYTKVVAMWEGKQMKIILPKHKIEFIITNIRYIGPEMAFKITFDPHRK